MNTQAIPRSDSKEEQADDKPFDIDEVETNLRLIRQELEDIKATMEALGIE